jgi:hypothetical protein
MRARRLLPIAIPATTVVDLKLPTISLLRTRSTARVQPPIERLTAQRIHEPFHRRRVRSGSNRSAAASATSRSLASLRRQMPVHPANRPRRPPPQPSGSPPRPHLPLSQPVRQLQATVGGAHDRPLWKRQRAAGRSGPPTKSPRSANALAEHCRAVPDPKRRALINVRG